MMRGLLNLHPKQIQNGLLGKMQESAMPQQQQRPSLRDRLGGILENITRFDDNGLTGAQRLQLIGAGLVDMDPMMGGGRLQATQQMIAQQQAQQAERQQAEQQRAQMEAFAATLPEDQRALFMANPQQFSRAAATAQFRAPQYQAFGQDIFRTDQGLEQVGQVERGPTERERLLTALQQDPSLMQTELELREAARPQTPGMYFTMQDGQPVIATGGPQEMGAAISAGVAGRQQEQHLNTIQNVNQLFDTIDILETEMAGAGRGSVGILADVRSWGTGAINQLDALLSYGKPGEALHNHIQQTAQEARRDLDQNSFDSFFSDRVSGVDLLVNTLAYSLAKVESPDNRVTDLDFRNYRNSLAGLSDEQLINQLRVVRDTYGQRAQRSAQALGQTFDRAPAMPPPAGGPPPQSGQTVEQYPEGTVIENDQGQRMVRRSGRWEPM